jgi:hypothetical protein
MILLRQLDELAATLDREQVVAEELRGALIAQRSAVAANDPGAMNAGLEIIGRTLFTLEEARRHRGEILTMLAGDARLPLDRLEQALGRPLPAAVHDARRRLCRTVERVANEARINHRVLQRALEAGNAYLHQLFTAAETPSPVYHACERRDEAQASGPRLVNRKA